MKAENRGHRKFRGLPTTDFFAHSDRAISSVGSEGSSKMDDTQSGRFSPHFNPDVTAFLFFSSIPRVKTAPKPPRFGQSKHRPLRLHAAILKLCGRLPPLFFSIRVNIPHVPSTLHESRAIGLLLAPLFPNRSLCLAVFIFWRNGTRPSCAVHRRGSMYFFNRYRVFLIVALYTIYSLSGCVCLYRRARGKELERVRAVC